MALGLPGKDSIEVIHTRLSELRPSLKAYVIARVVRMWETVLPGQTEPINGDLLLVDDMVHDRKKKFKSVPQEYTIYFSSSTKLIEVIENLQMYPRYFFRFAAMVDIMKRSENDPVFTDTIGMFVGYGEPVAVLVDSGTRTSHKVDVNLRLLSDDILRVSFWVSHIQHLNLAELAAMAEKPVFAVAGTTVRSYSDTKYLCSSSSTKVYVNPDIAEAQEIRQRFKDDRTPVVLLTSDQATQSLASTNAKDATIVELLYLDVNKAQGQKYKVEAEVIEVDTTNGWYYECCSGCPFKVHPAKGGGFECTQHGVVTPRLVMQLTLMIKDETADDFEVTVFGPLAENLIGVNITAEVSDRGVHPNKLPSTAKDLGKQIIGSASDAELPTAANLPEQLLASDDSQTCLDSPSIPSDLFAEFSPLKKIKQEPTPNDEKKEQETKKRDQSHSSAQPQQKILPRESRVKQVSASSSI
ncbi:Nucleic acid-binding protein [Corchorus olitorius]|uniref:Nucleic acid-binding protein n=1 Tax=Corchorus olitorius TaxID=93759 RepID=A0A1R3KCS8_9ROSI|nr:Nucleic acid-binding protein [Corchorus olitorius]